MKTFFKENIVEILLSSAVMSSVAYIYSCSDALTMILFTALSAVYVALIFAMYEALRRKGKKILTAGCLIAFFFAVFNLTPFVAGWNFGEFTLWFMEPTRFGRIYQNRIAALILILGAVLVSALYYFTRVRYRGFFLFLICICPFCLFAKTFTDIPVIYPIVITTLFFMIMTGQSAGVGQKKTKSFYICVSVFIAAVTTMAAFMPKMEYSPYRENFDEFITGVNIGAAGKADYNDFSDSSSGSVTDDDTRVFSIYGDNPVLIKRQCFNLYDGKNNVWTYYGDSNSGHSKWLPYTYFEDPASIGADISSQELSCTIKTESTDMRAIYTCENMTDIDLGYYKKGRIYRTELDEYFIPYDSEEFPTSYSLTWYDFPLDTRFSEKCTDKYISTLDNSAADSYARTKEQALQYDEYLLDETVRKNCFSSESAWKRVSELSHKLTDSFETAYEKAQVIENYLQTAGFIYDKDFNTANPAPDHFIFSSKRGACQSYATAMVLMCREIGLTARYTEGFWIQNYDTEKKCWSVTANDSHAYVQVWIDGYGWTDFNPVSSVIDSGIIDPTFIFVGIAAFLIAGVIMLAAALKPYALEAAYRRRIEKARGTEQLRLIYNRINMRVNERLLRKKNTLTPQETAVSCRRLFGYDAEELAKVYEKAVYGGICDESADRSADYREFTAKYKAAKKAEKKKKKK